MLRSTVFAALLVASAAGRAAAGPTAASWAEDPFIRAYVGPADYAWDFNAPAGAPAAAPGFATSTTSSRPVLAALWSATGRSP